MPDNIVKHDSRKRHMRTAIALVAGCATAVTVMTAEAASTVTVPAGTKVLLRFETPVNAAAIHDGATVAFSVARDVLVARTVVFRQDTPAHGVVTGVSKPGILGKNARVHIADIETEAVDGRTVRLAPLEVTADSIRAAAGVGAAGAAAAITGAILLGSVGVAAGALIRGGNVILPAGAVGTSSVAEEAQVNVP